MVAGIADSGLQTSSHSNYVPLTPRSDGSLHPKADPHLLFSSVEIERVPPPRSEIPEISAEGFNPHAELSGSPVRYSPTLYPFMRRVLNTSPRA